MCNIRKGTYRPSIGQTVRQTLAQVGAALGVAAALVALLVLVGPREAPFVAASGAPVVVIGSSIALAAVAPESLSARVALPVDNLAVRGSQVAHQVAIVRHILPRDTPPEVVVWVTPLDALLRERLRSPVDVARLSVLLATPDPALWEAAVGSSGIVAFGNQRRAGIRQAALGALADWLPRSLGWSDHVDRARASMSSIPRDAGARPTWVVDPGAPRPGAASEAPADREPERVPPEQWSLVPLAAQALSSTRLLVVAPPVEPRSRGGACSRSALERSVAQQLLALGVQVLDLTELPVEARWFRTRYHVEGQGTLQATHAIADAVLDGPPFPRCLIPR